MTQYTMTASGYHHPFITEYILSGKPILLFSFPFYKKFAM